MAAPSDPPSLAGPLARIDRADENLRNLEREFTAFLGTRPYTAVPKVDPNPSNRTFSVTDVKPVPLPLRVLVGEIPHHLRASFDLLIYQLLLQQGVTDQKRLRACGFPIIVKCNLVDPKDRQEYKATITGQIHGVSAKAHARIEALQPCVAGNKGEWSFLAQIAELDNTDKHRLMLAILSGTYLRNFEFHDAGKVVTIPDAYVPLQADAMFTISPVRPGVDVDLNLATAITFGEPGPVFGHPVVPTLQNLSNLARDTINLFSDCF